VSCRNPPSPSGCCVRHHRVSGLNPRQLQLPLRHTLTPLPRAVAFGLQEMGALKVEFHVLAKK
jgi:hypothetical protein